DTKAPSVAITDDEPGTANIAGGDVVYTFQFSETVTGFTAADVVVVGGTKRSEERRGGEECRAGGTPAAGVEGDLEVDVAVGWAGAQDANANPDVRQAL